MPAYRRGSLYVAVSFLVVGGLLGVGLISGMAPQPESADEVAIAQAQALTSRSIPVVSKPDAELTPVELAQRDPWAFLRRAQQNFTKRVSHYTATFTKQERLDGALSNVQSIDFRHREASDDAPRIVYLQFLQGAENAKRVYFEDSPEFVNDEGEKFAMVEPHGFFRALVAEWPVPVDGPRARQSSRHSIEWSGFGKFFELYERYNQLASDKNVLDLRFAGVGEVDGRETIVIERYLPYDGTGEPWPDGYLITHFDRELLVPLAIESYADDSRQKLIGRYVYTNVKLNPTLPDDAFTF